jgi:hypothetical protein
MLKIIDLHPSPSAQGEYVVLQNQGLTTLSLRGWAVCTDAYLTGDTAAASQEMFVFTEDAPIKPYTRIVLFTGEGEAGWCSTVDGKQAYVVYWNRTTPVWSSAEHLPLIHVAASRRVVQPEDRGLAVGYAGIV